MLLSYFSYHYSVTGGMAGTCPENTGNITFINPIQGKLAASAIQLTDSEKITSNCNNY
jgi:hypothetical protein